MSASETIYRGDSKSPPRRISGDQNDFKLNVLNALTQRRVFNGRALGARPPLHCASAAVQEYRMIREGSRQSRDTMPGRFAASVMLRPPTILHLFNGFRLFTMAGFNTKPIP
mmetsp:Transcript_70787/g.188979  ORF Transcript_70787/g.188979 Transcript_70787/m.188979 type:complete len:112 (+) Transcript_70787:606-941(+)